MNSSARPAASRRLFVSLAAALAVVGSLLSPVLSAPTAAEAFDAPYVGDSLYNLAWPDLTLGEMYVGVPYSDTLDGPADWGYWSASGMTGLPAGLSLSVTPTQFASTITISGTPTSAGDVNFYITYHDSSYANVDLVYFDVTVKAAPATTIGVTAAVKVSNTITPLLSVTPGGNFDFLLSVQNTGPSNPTYAASISTTLPDSVVVNSWSQYPNYDCTRSGQTFSCLHTGNLLPGQGVYAVRIAVTLDPGYSEPSFSAASHGAAANAPDVDVTETTRVTLPGTVLIAPFAAPYSQIDLTAYPAGEIPVGTVQFAIDEAVDVNLGSPVAVNASTGIATYSGAIPASYIGSSVNIIAHYSGGGVNPSSTSAATSVYVYRSRTLSGTIYLNGVPFTGTAFLKLTRMTPSPTWDSTSWANPDGTYTIGPAYLEDLDDVTAPYAFEVQLQNLGVGGQYDVAGSIMNPNSNTATLVSFADFTSGMNLYFTAAVPEFTDETLSRPRVGVAYNDSIGASGPGVTISVDPSTPLPAGLSIDAAGNVTGLPTTAGDTTVNFWATSEAGQDSFSMTISVDPAYNDPAWTEEDVVDGFRVGESYTDGVAASGDPTIVYSTATGSIPAGVTLNTSTGALTGTPTTAGPYSFSLRAANSHTGVTTAVFSGTVQPAWIAPYWLDDVIGVPQGGVAFSDEVTAAGDGTLTYSVPLGALPSWLHLNTATGALTGTPALANVADPYSFTVTVTSVHGTETVTFSGVVAAAPEAELDVDFGSGDTAAGADFDFDIDGAAPGAAWSVTVNSTPVVVASGLTSVTGTASGSASIPLSIGAGAHSIVLTTLAADGSTITTTVWFTVLRNGTIGAVSLLGPLAYTEAALAGTGVDPMLPVGVAALLLFLGFAVLRTRRALSGPSDRRGRLA